jgi:hypothetical protein
LALPVERLESLVEVELAALFGQGTYPVQGVALRVGHAAGVFQKMIGHFNGCWKHHIANRNVTNVLCGVYLVDFVLV